MLELEVSSYYKRSLKNNSKFHTISPKSDESCLQEMVTYKRLLMLMVIWYAKFSVHLQLWCKNYCLKRFTIYLKSNILQVLFHSWIFHCVVAENIHLSVESFLIWSFPPLPTPLVSNFPLKFGISDLPPLQNIQWPSKFKILVL